jgi:hypothetical protein
MPPGEIATRLTVWLALLFWLGAEWFSLRASKLLVRQWFFGISAVVFLAHVILAFHVFYGWSQTTALADVRRQTMEVTGFRWSIGLWINYAFAALWIVEALWLAIAPALHAARPGWIKWAVRGVFWFMAFNGTVVFVKGPQRWLGLAICLAVLPPWWQCLVRTKSRHNADEP